MKLSHLLILFLMCTSFVFGDAVGFGTTAAEPAGSGTSGDPYQIATLGNLSWLSQNDTKWGSSYYYEQTANISASQTQYWDDSDDGDGDLYNEPDDITSTGNNEGWSPIGLSSPAFSAHYDGQGYTIDGLTINRSTTDYIGFFGYTSGANISNLGLTNISVSGQAYVAALVGRNTSSTTITNCFASGTINADGLYAGGIAGYNSASISQSFTSCSVTNSSGYTGGFVGQNYDAGNITNCYSTGAVSAGVRTGGFVGYNDNYPATISYSYSSGSVSSSSVLGSFCATNTQVISHCFYDSEASGQGSTSDGGTPKTTAQMKDYTTFTGDGWDFVSESANGGNDFWDADQGSTVNNGYMILAWQDGADTSLPVELSAFEANSDYGAVQLSWTTSSEVENLGFILERKQIRRPVEDPASGGEVQEGWLEIASFKTHLNFIGQGSTTSETCYEFLDKAVTVGQSYSYRLSDVDFQGKVTTHKVVSVLVNDQGQNARPGSFKIDAIYPNPFNPGTSITYTLEKSGPLAISILDLKGRTVKTLTHNETVNTGSYTLYWDGSAANGERLSSGIYLIRISSKSLSQVHKITMLD